MSTQGQSWEGSTAGSQEGGNTHTHLCHITQTVGFLPSCIFTPEAQKTKPNRSLFAWLVLAVRQQQFPPAERWAACVCPHQDLSCSVLSLLVTAYPETHRHGSTTAGHPTHPSLSPHAGFTHPAYTRVIICESPTYTYYGTTGILVLLGKPPQADQCAGL